jgi:aquaporin Z
MPLNRKMMQTFPLLAETLGTYLLILMVLASGGNAFIVGGTLALIIFLIGKISGGHVNPAVSLAFFLKGNLSIKELAAYIAAQFLGATASFYTFKVFA